MCLFQEESCLLWTACHQVVNHPLKDDAPEKLRCYVLNHPGDVSFPALLNQCTISISGTLVLMVLPKTSEGSTWGQLQKNRISGLDLHFGLELSELWLSPCFYRNINIQFLHSSHWLSYLMAYKAFRLYLLRTESAYWDKFSEFQEVHLQSFSLTKTLQNGL